jgi:hypothetical protein
MLRFDLLHSGSEETRIGVVLENRILSDLKQPAVLRFVKP